MTPSHRTRAALAALALAVLPAAVAAKSSVSCAKGQVPSHGRCMPACATAGAFADVDACECPPGFGKILLGGGGGECRPLACPTNKQFPASSCECRDGYVKKPTSGGKAKCVARNAP